MPVLNVRVVLVLQEADLGPVTPHGWINSTRSSVGSVTPQDSASQAGQVLLLEVLLAAIAAMAASQSFTKRSAEVGPVRPASVAFFGPGVAVSEGLKDPWVRVGLLVAIFLPRSH
ncbi:hypothetical protein E2C01_072657 [Portunus trituberculatus]|uniref:Uncharacterized protein n=1 Tax=Portunus trituberculatus TaxID=210409 RepID=A0A5B7I7S0_PORTR|nr:hypothetical protein [Portunus trituberculatus]